jgi:hypothetical protein
MVLIGPGLGDVGVSIEANTIVMRNVFITNGGFFYYNESL